MPYVNFDDNYPEHVKVDNLSDAAFRLHTSAICYCAKQLTDGKLGTDRPPRLVPRYRTAALKELLGAGMWHDLGTGCGTETCPEGEADLYQIHDYLQWNKSREWWEHKREADAKRLADWRSKKGA
jgi:hypothetical protein